GWSSFALVGNRLCTQEQRDEDEVVVCYDAATGDPIWVHAYAARFWEAMGGPGPRATPAYHRGSLYALGATGVLNRLDVSTGEASWTRNIAEDTAAPVPTWAFSSSPLVVDDIVVVHAPAAPDGRGLVAYDLATGEPRWFGEASGTGYSSPHLATIGGRRQILMISAAGVSGFDVTTGETLWSHEWPPSAGGDRVVQPAVVDDGEAILMATVDGGTRKIKVSMDAEKTWKAEEVWTSRSMKSYYNDLVIHRGTAFGFDRNILAAIDVATGDRVWKGGRYGNGQVLLLPDQDLLLVLSEQGELALVKASTDGYEEMAKVEALEGKTWNHPIVADGVLYVRNSEQAAAYRL
ncbi:MAG: PQQ-binding-like beta-propeller repeat protein, partial [Acidobacteria bacterium]|nr:PQQ-binding-like beta-propeller repeat protein [Acidobacteriota bacterium]NIO57996.1 PQQ-binding-like beta-propeller repeat protein [Acidobacteriota bacterium]NIQ28998.1 PQQ-binding-like beta-propeller repeat protein [Acidobacteriota bacterium]NIQ83518.1 PQQ-binding-like beta-propeller repeat protein [Acidobacteriota bacterium]